jgi:abortive infection protein
MKKIINISMFLITIDFLRVIVGFVIEKMTGSSDKITLAIIYGLTAYILDIPMIYYFIRNNKKKKYFVTKEKMNIGSFIGCFALMALITAIIGIISLVFKLKIESNDNSILPDYPTLYLNMTLFSTIIIAPIIEEMIFRGVIMNDLKEYGYKTAIIINSVLFGLAHTEIEKVIITIFLGIIFSYVAYRYSLRYSILLHMVWNLNSSIGSIFYYNKMPDEMIIWFVGVLSLVLIIISIYGIIKKKYILIFSVFRFSIEDRKNMTLFLKNNAIFLIMVSVIFFTNFYLWYL